LLFVKSILSHFKNFFKLHRTNRQSQAILSVATVFYLGNITSQIALGFNIDYN